METIIWDAFKSDQISRISSIIVIFFVVWLYKEFRGYAIENEKINNERIDKALEAYGELQLEISNYLKQLGNIEKVIQKISRCYPFFPKYIFKIVINWNKNRENEDMRKLENELEKEIKRLKYQQFNKVNYCSDKDIFEMLEYFFIVELKVKSFIYPSIYTIISAVTLMLIMQGTIVAERLNTYNTVLLYAATITCVFYVLFIMCILQFMLQRRFKHTVKNWIAFIFFIASKISLIVIQPLYSWISIFFIVVYMFFLHKSRGIRSVSDLEER